VIGLLSVVLEAVRLALRGVAALAAVRFAWQALRALRAEEVTAPPWVGPAPEVLVQLPVRDEEAVIERLLWAVCALDHPRASLCIQVVDSSRPAARAQTAALVEAARGEGAPVELLEREQPAGFKAGSLALGLTRSAAEYVAVFDADALPPPDFLARALPAFADPGVAYVQARWSFPGRDTSLLTRLQALVLDSLFLTAHPPGEASGFHGSGGILRRASLDAVGGWRPEALAEDLDLTVRLALAGWRGVQLRDLVVPCELPADMGAFRRQQRRWAFGAGQALRAHGRAVLGARLPLVRRAALLARLGRHALYPLLLINGLAVPFTTLCHVHTPLFYGVGVNLGLLAAVLGTLLLRVLVAEVHAGGRPRDALLTPALVPLVLGLTPTYTVAFLGGLLGARLPFERTPKGGLSEAGGLSWLVPVELCLALGFAAAAVLAVERGILLYGAFLACFSGGVAWVAVGSLRTAWRRGRG
jgi:hypothetical protein